MIETAIKEDLFLDSKLIIPENRMDAIRIMNELHPVVGGQPTNVKNQPNDNNPILDLACTILNIHESGVGVHADLRKIQNEPPKYFYGKGFMSGISSLKGNGILAVYGQWRDASGRYAIKQFYYTDKEILWRNAVSDTAWSAWFDVLTGNSDLDYNKLLNVPLTSTLSDDKTKIASIFAVNNVNRAAVNAQKTANTANANAVDAMNEAKKKRNSNDHDFSGGSWASGINLYRSEDSYSHYHKLMTYSTKKGSFAIIGYEVGNQNFDHDYIIIFPKTSGTVLTTGTTTVSKKGFLRFSGSMEPLTEDQLTSTLQDSNTLVATIGVVNGVNRTAKNAEKIGINADAKAVTAQTRADAAFSKVKPIAEGGTGATTAAQGRKNMGHGDASTRNVATSLESNGNTLVPLSILKESRYGFQYDWVDVSKERLINTPYINESDDVIHVSISTINAEYDGSSYLEINGVKHYRRQSRGQYEQMYWYLPIPPRAIYKLQGANGISFWGEFKKA